MIKAIPSSTHSFFNTPGLQHRLQPLKYLPSPLLPNSLSQVLYHCGQPAQKIEGMKEMLKTKDGATTSLMWGENPYEGKPLVFIMHGLTGGSSRNYIIQILLAARKYSYSAVAFNSRGIEDPLLTPKPFSGHDFQDLSQAIVHARQVSRCSRLYVVGFSFGANVMLRYLSKHPGVAQAFIGVSTPFDVVEALQKMPFYYNNFFNKLYKKGVLANQQVIAEGQSRYGYTMQQILNTKDISQFHTSYTCKVFGITLQQLYSSMKVNPKTLSNLNCPSLFLHALDDRIVSFKQVPNIRQVKDCNLLVTDKGSHTCWFEGWPPSPWYSKPIFAFVDYMELRCRF